MNDQEVIFPSSSAHSSFRFHDAQDGVPVDVLEREVDPMSGLVHGDRVGLVGQLPGGLPRQGAVVFVEDADNAGLRGDVEAAEFLVEGENVRGGAGGDPAGDPPLLEVNDQELGVVFASEKREAAVTV